MSRAAIHVVSNVVRNSDRPPTDHWDYLLLTSVGDGVFGEGVDRPNSLSGHGTLPLPDGVSSTVGPRDTSTTVPAPLFPRLGVLPSRHHRREGRRT